MRKVFLIIAFLFTVLLSCLSGPYHEAPANTIPLIGNPMVELSGHIYPLKTQQLRAVISREDIPALPYFKNLRQADFRGSACYEEIYQWSLQNPDVDVIFSFPLPTGEMIDSNSSSLDLSTMAPENIAQLERYFNYLTKLRYINLGRLEEGKYNAKDLSELKANRPELEFDFQLDLSGKHFDFSTTSLDLSQIQNEDVPLVLFALPFFDNLDSIELGNQNSPSTDISLESIRKIKDIKPNVNLNCNFELYGKEVRLDAKELDFRGVPVDDDGQKLAEILPCMNACKKVDMDNTGVSNESLDKIRRDNPDVELIWRVWFGENYSVRTDTERIFASKPTVGGMIYDADVLKYCTKVKYLDLGHNDELSDLSFVTSMPKLEVLIIAMTGITDLSPLAQCPKLEYLEINSSSIADLTALANSTELRHLNIASCPGITDISALYNISKLERLWIGRETPIPEEQVKTMKSKAPNCNINVTTEDPHGEAWRFTHYDPDEPKYYWVPRHLKLREQLGYDYQEYSFYWLDPLCDMEAPLEFRGQFGKEVYGL